MESSLTAREGDIVRLIRQDPLITPEQLARALDTTRAAVNVHLSNLMKKGALLGRGYVVREGVNVVVIGGANVDLKCRTYAPAVMRTSNPGSTRTAPGGVGRNIADNLGRLGVNTYIITAVGCDALGDRLLAETGAVGVNVDHVIRGAADTGTYTAVLDADGELLLAIAAMEVMEEITPEVLHVRRQLIERANILVLDCNLPESGLAYALRAARDANVPVIIDPVSVPKAERLRPLFGAGLGGGVHIHTITPNVDELAALTSSSILNDDDIQVAAEELHAMGVQHVWVRLGARGSLLSSITTDGVHAELIPAHAVVVVDVTGAGDAMVAAYVYAVLRELEPSIAARYGHVAAALTVASDQTVSPLMSAAALEAAPPRQQPQEPCVAPLTV